MINPFSKPSSDPASFGHHFHVRLNGTELDDIDRRVLEELRPIGVQLTNHNFDQKAPYEAWLTKLDRLLADVHRRTGRRKMLVTIDHEGGRVHRTPPPLTHFPSPRKYVSLASDVGKAMAIELRSIGVNCSFSPSVDIDSNPKNPVIGARSFGANPVEVTAAARRFIEAMRQSGVVPCIKHFPGHGDTVVDSHHELPTVRVDREVFFTREFAPFEALTREAVPMVMTAHIVFPALDPEFPATLSRDVLDALLRRRLGYGGVVISDDLDMNAISDHFDELAIAKLAIPAGCDLLLFNHHPIRALKVARYLYEFFEEGVIREGFLAASSERIAKLLHSVLPSRPAPLSPEVFSSHAELAARFGGD